VTSNFPATSKVPVTSTIPAAVAHAARAFGSAPALVEPGARQWSWEQVHAEVRRVARALIAYGLQPGDRLAVWAPNSAQWMLTALGASYAGLTLVPVNTRYTGVEALDVIHRSDARGLVVTGPFLGVDRLAALRAAAAEDGIPLPRLIVTLPDDWKTFLAYGDDVPAGRADARADAVAADDVADILFTSGTTGRSKGVMSAHRQSLAVAAAWAGIAGLRPGDRYLVINPFFHSFGLKAGILACLVSGATIVPQAVFDVDASLGVIERERITVMPGPPTLYTSILNHPDRDRYDLSSLRVAVTGATTVPVALIERLHRELTLERVLTAYGLTETAGTATMCRPDDTAQTVANTCGGPVPGVEIAVVGADGKPVSTGEPGEVLIRGYNVMRGYLDDVAATDAAVDADGWLHTGDIGVLDTRGYLRITDRLKDMFIAGGFNVYPAEVEQVLARHEAVAEVAVVGAPDERLGEVGRAVVVLRHDRSTDAAALIAYCRERLANYKVPRVVEFVPALPRNASGKVVKSALR
jgi:acyl-CoA synthetase (AMP-forming)/AMP-acid ligase II